MRLFRVSSKAEARQTQLVAPISSARKDAPDADRRWPDSSLGKGYTLPATSSGAVLRGASDRRHGSSRCGPGADPPGAVGSGLERLGHRRGAEIPRPLRHHGVVLSRRPEWSRPRRALERAAGHARPALLFQRAAQTGVDDRREPRLAMAPGRTGRRAGGPPGSSAFRPQPELLTPAKPPTVAVKATGQPGYAEDAYPFRSFHEHLHRVFDAFGPDRMFWGTDITRMPCSWRQCVTVFTEELPWLKGRDLDLVMGEAL